MPRVFKEAPLARGRGGMTVHVVPRFFGKSFTLKPQHVYGLQLLFAPTTAG